MSAIAGLLHAQSLRKRARNSISVCWHRSCNADILLQVTVVGRWRQDMAENILRVREKESNEHLACVLHRKYCRLADGGEWAIIAAGRQLQLSNFKLSTLAAAGTSERSDFLLLPTEHASLRLGHCDTTGGDSSMKSGGDGAGALGVSESMLFAEDMLIDDFCSSFEELLAAAPQTAAAVDEPPQFMSCSVLGTVQAVRRVLQGPTNGPAGKALFQPAAVLTLGHYGNDASIDLWLFDRQATLVDHVQPNMKIGLQWTRLCWTPDSMHQLPDQSTPVSLRSCWLVYEDHCTILYTFGNDVSAQSDAASQDKPSSIGALSDLGNDFDNRPLRLDEMGTRGEGSGLLCQLRHASLQCESPEATGVLFLTVAQPAAWWGQAGPSSQEAVIEIKSGAYADASLAEFQQLQQELRSGQLLWISRLSLAVESSKGERAGAKSHWMCQVSSDASHCTHIRIVSKMKGWLSTGWTLRQPDHPLVRVLACAADHARAGQCCAENWLVTAIVTQVHWSPKKRRLPNSYDLTGSALRHSESKKSDETPNIHAQADLATTGEGIIAYLSFEERLKRDNAAVPVVDIVSDDEAEKTVTATYSSAPASNVVRLRSSKQCTDSMKGSRDAVASVTTHCPDAEPVHPEIYVRLDDGTSSVLAELHPLVAAEMLPSLGSLADELRQQECQQDGARSADALGSVDEYLTSQLLGREFRLALTLYASREQGTTNSSFGRVDFRVDCCLPNGSGGRSAAIARQLYNATIVDSSRVQNLRARFSKQSLHNSMLEPDEDEDGSMLLDCF
eukprot:SAG31_NODE_684_length_12833_cov_8.046411_6_plen_787_part_00